MGLFGLFGGKDVPEINLPQAPTYMTAGEALTKGQDFASQLAPLALGARSRQLFTALPSTRIVQAPQLPVSQPTFVPIRFNCSRNTSAKVHHGSTNTSSSIPFTLNLMTCFILFLSS